MKYLHAIYSGNISAIFMPYLIRMELAWTSHLPPGGIRIEKIEQEKWFPQLIRDAPGSTFLVLTKSNWFVPATLLSKPLFF